MAFSRYDKLALRVDEGLAEIALDRPAVLNAIDAGLAGQLNDALGEIAGRQDVRALLVRGEGSAFCAGGDIKSFDGTKPHADIALSTMAHFHSAVLRLATLPIPTIAHVHRAVAGAGVGLMLACDLAYATPDARLSLAYSKIGATVDGGASWFLPRLVGDRKAKELTFLSVPIDASSAVRLGLVNGVHDGDDPLGQTREIALALAKGPTRAYDAVKRLICPDMANALCRHLDAERDAFAEIAAGRDFAEGMAAFIERRVPSFDGK